MTESSTGKAGLSALIKSLKPLAEIEDKIRSCLSSEAPMLSEISNYLLELGGKRIRPALCVLVSRAFGQESINTELRDVAAGIELIHMATLLHDDIIDKSPKRRNSESAFLRYGLPNTLLAGDFLLVRSFALCAHLDEFIVAETEKACIELTEGEILEIPLFETKLAEADSLEIARKKTASLFRLSALSAAHLCGASPEVVKKLAEFGECSGMAFQILDDVLDVQADEDLLGKRTGTDLRERKPALVNVLWLESGSELSKTLLSPPLETEAEESFVAAALEELRAEGNPVLEACRMKAREYGEKALKALAEAKELAPELESTAELELLTRAALARLH